jgi:two-component system, sensor histidine kinase and response regulator
MPQAAHTRNRCRFWSPGAPKETRMGEKRPAQSDHSRVSAQEHRVLEMLFQVIPDILFVLNEEGAVIDYRSMDERNLYVRPEQFLNRPIDEFLPPDAALSTRNNMHQARSSGELTTSVYELPVAEGKRTFESRMRFIPDPGIFIVIIRDISQLKEAEDRYREEQQSLNRRVSELQALYGIMSAASQTDRSFAAILSDCADLIRQSLPDPQLAGVTVTWNDIRVSSPHTVSGSPLCAVSRDLENDGSLTVTIRTADDEADGHLRHPPEEHQALLEGAADSIASFIARKQTLQHLAEREVLLDEVGRQTADAVVVVDPMNADIEQVIQLNIDLFGYSAEDLRRRGLSILVSDRSREELAGLFRDALKAPVSLITHIRTGRGEVRDVRIAASAVPYQGRSLTVTVWRDITAETAAAEQERRHAERLGIYRRLLAEFSRSPEGIRGEVTHFCSSAAETLVREVGFTGVGIWLYENDLQNLRRVAFRESGSASHPEETVRPLSDFPAPLIEERESQFVLLSPEDESSSFLRLRQDSPLLGCDVLYNGQRAGFIIYEIPEGHEVPAYDDVNFCCQAADQISTVLHNSYQIRTAEELARNEAVLKRAQEVSHTGHLFLDVKTGLLSASDEAYYMFGLHPGSQADSRQFLEAVFRDDLPAVQQVVQKALEGIRTSTEFRITDADELRWIEGRAEPQFSDKGAVISVLGIVREVTEQKAAHEALEVYRQHLEDLVSTRTRELERARRAAVSASNAKSAFLSNMSHEIRTPLNAILGYAHLLQQDNLTSRQKQQVRRLFNSAEHLLQLINDVLDLSKIDADALTLSIEDFEPLRLIDHVCDMLSEKAALKNLDLYVDWDPDVPPVLRGDGRRFSQILLNIIGNAVKFTPSGSVTITGTAAFLSPERAELTVRIEDTGIGVQEDKTDLIFNAFEQADSSISRNYGGTGLGLAISRRLAELMGGSIKLESREQEGTTVTIILPYERVRTAAGQNPLELPFQGKHALILGSPDRISSQLETLLAHFGIPVDRTASEEEAAQLLRTSKGALSMVFLPWKGGERDAFSLIERLGAVSDKASRLCYIITAYPSQILQQQQFPDQYRIRVLNRPITATRLRDVLSRISADGPFIHEQADLTEAYRRIFSRGQTIRVLLVEDNPVNRDVALQLLTIVNIAVETAENGRKAVETAARQQFDLVLMDIQMPEMDGYEASVSLRSLPGWEHVPIIAMTALAFTEDRERSLTAGMSGHLSKPVTPLELYRCIAVQLGRETEAESASTEEHEEEGSGRPEITETAVKEKNLNRIPDWLLDSDELDVERGLTYTMNDLDTYLDIIKLFADTHAADGEQLALLVSHSESPAVAALAHKLKGAAAAVGAIKLQAAADKLESAAKRGLTEAAEEAVDAVRFSLEGLITLVRYQLADEPSASSSRDASGEHIRLLDSETDSVAAQLISCLEAHDTEALFLAETYENLLRPYFGSRSRTIYALIENFDFAQALEEVNRAMHRAAY